MKRDEYKMTQQVDTTDYKQKYEQALKVASQWHKDGIGDVKTIVECVFPELKESEDERIIKVQLNYWRSVGGKEWYGVPVQETIAWLEKQGEQKPTPKFKIGDTIHKIGENTVFPRTIEKIEDGCYVCNNSRSFIFIKFQDEYELVEYKLVDEYEPKFKVGDWITNGEYTWKVIDIKPLDYLLQAQNGDVVGDTISYVDEEFHLWTIQDAKKGDVLVCIGKYGQEIGIVKEYVGKYGGCDKCFETYCFVDWEGIFRTGEYMGSKEIHPATKEQHNTLMKAIADNRYTFDFENKKLNKIEQKPVEWSDEDEKMYNMFRSMAHGTYVVQTQETIDSLLSWLKSIKPNHWKPSEEQMEALKYCIDSLGERTTNFSEYYDIESLYNALKKL